MVISNKKCVAFSGIIVDALIVLVFVIAALTYRAAAGEERRKKSTESGNL